MLTAEQAMALKAGDKVVMRPVPGSPVGEVRSVTRVTPHRIFLGHSAYYRTSSGRQQPGRPVGGVGMAWIDGIATRSDVKKAEREEQQKRSVLEQRWQQQEWRLQKAKAMRKLFNSDSGLRRLLPDVDVELNRDGQWTVTFSRLSDIGVQALATTLEKGMEAG